mgnify:FL=1
MSGKGDKTRVTNLTRYRKNYTKIFTNWKKNVSAVISGQKEEKVQKRRNVKKKT